MSFSALVKNEICRAAKQKSCCKLSELSAFLHMAGSIAISRNKFALRADTENPAVARRAYTLIKDLFSITARIEMKHNRLKKNHIYSLLIDNKEDALKVLNAAGIICGGSIFKNDTIDKSIIEKKCCKKAYLRGAFLGGASISDPKKMYHLEFVSGTKEFTEDLAYILNSLGFGAKMAERKSQHIVYLKEGDKISEFLSLIGAYSAVMEFENVRILKEMRNQVNRAVNCETANLSKTVNAAVRQIKNILYIKDNMGFEKLSPVLRETAELRINNPESSLHELCEQLSEPLGRSGINHRLRRLNEIAENLKKEKGEI